MSTSENREHNPKKIPELDNTFKLTQNQQDQLTTIIASLGDPGDSVEINPVDDELHVQVIRRTPGTDPEILDSISLDPPIPQD